MAQVSNLDKSIKIGPKTRKILLLLAGGLALSFCGRPDHYFRIIKGISNEWKEVNNRTLREAIKKLYQSKMIEYKEKGGGVVEIVISENGKKLALQYNIDDIKIKKPVKWDKLWRVVIFDIPEHLKKERNALSSKLREIGFYPLQKSVFLYPYKCRREIDFIVEIFNLRSYVRYLVVKETDVDIDLKKRFNLQ